MLVGLTWWPGPGQVSYCGMLPRGPWPAMPGAPPGRYHCRGFYCGVLAVGSRSAGLPAFPGSRFWPTVPDFQCRQPAHPAVSPARITVSPVVYLSCGPILTFLSSSRDRDFGLRQGIPAVGCAAVSHPWILSPSPGSLPSVLPGALSRILTSVPGSRAAIRHTLSQARRELRCRPYLIVHWLSPCSLPCPCL